MITVTQVTRKRVNTVWRCTIALSLAILLISDAQAVSRAGGLFLRIPVGARATAMGESNIAVADDATATHWNPAGLGAPPMSGSWLTFDIPENYRPLRSFAAIKASGMIGHQLWALSDNGLIVNDGSGWRNYTLYHSEVDETIESIVRKYTQSNDDSVIAHMLTIVGDMNNPRPRTSIAELEAKTLATLPEQSTAREEITNGFVSLAKAYDKLTINWERYAELERMANDTKPGSMADRDVERLRFALEKSVRRYVPEDIRLPFAMVFAGKPTSLASQERTLWVGSESGLYRFQNDNWVTFSVKPGDTAAILPSNKITSLSSHNNILYVGTDMGMVTHFGLTWERVKTGLPAGVVSGVAFSSPENGWAIVDGDMYKYDGKVWQNYTDFKAGIDQTASTIAESFAIYGTDAEKSKYLAKLSTLNPDLAADGKLTLGQTLKAPIVAEIKGEITALCATEDQLWVGTAQGILMYGGKGWTRYGYSPLTTKRSMSVTEIALDITKGDSAQALVVASKIREQNDLTYDTVDSGRTIWVYRNIAGSRVTDVAAVDGVVYVTTVSGALAFDGQMTRFDESGLGGRPSMGVKEIDGQLWFATDTEIKFLREPARFLSLMYAKWLPELSDDLFVSYLSYVSNVGGVGTMGLSIKYVSYGSIERRTPTGDPDGTELPFDLAVGVSYGTALNQSTSIGATIKGVWSHLASQGTASEVGNGNATAIAVDAGVMTRVSERLTIGAALTNLGTKLTYVDAQQADNLPTNIGVGAAFKAIKSDVVGLMFTSDFNSQILVEKQLEPVFNLGGEFSYAEIFAIRAGYVNDKAGDKRILTLGTGLNLKSQSLDFEYYPSTGNKVFANTVLVSASLRF